MKKTYKTNEVAKLIGIHPNTVRKYEDLGFIPKPERRDNGYRIFTDVHIDQFRIVRKAFQIEVLQSGLRKKIIEVVKLSAAGEYNKAIVLTDEYILAAEKEINNANEAADIASSVLNGSVSAPSVIMKRNEVSKNLGITMDTLRNWEMNGLLKVKRKKNGYRIYTGSDLQKLKIIRSLRCANYSLSAILRMMNALENNSQINVTDILNSPDVNEDIVSVCDKLILSLEDARNNAIIIKSMLYKMKNKY